MLVLFIHLVLSHFLRFLSSLFAQVMAFCMERLSKCYRAVCDWKQLEQWKAHEAEILQLEENSCLRRQMPESVALQQTTCLRKFEYGEELALKELADWNILDLESSKASWSSAKTMIECSNTLTNIAMKIHLEQTSGRDLHQDIVNSCLKVAAKTMEEGLRNVPSEYLNEAILAQYSAAGLLDLLGCQSPTLGTKVFQISQVGQC